MLQLLRHDGALDLPRAGQIDVLRAVAHRTLEHGEVDDVHGTALKWDGATVIRPTTASDMGPYPQTVVAFSPLLP